MSTENFIYQPPQGDLEVLFEDQDIIIINKPAGLLSVPGRLAQHYDSAYARILAIYPAAKVIHRLDMATSGILIFAKHREIEVAMSKLFQQKQIKKQYIALVEGRLASQGCVDAPMITDWENRPRQKIDFIAGKSAQTLYQRIDYSPNDDISRVALTPITGRSHQLRLHMAHIQHPIMGDKLYHPQPERSPLARLALHACQIQFVQPLTQQAIQIDCQADF